MSDINNIHLFNSLNTIIFDNINLYDVENGLKSINYPSLDQYYLYKQKKILNLDIHFNKNILFDSEFFLLLTNKILYLTLIGIHVIFFGYFLFLF